MIIMPNWANCRLWVDGPEEDVNDFFSKLLVKKNDEMVLDYSILVPLTEDGSYDYAMANWKWGTKWEGSDASQCGWNCVYFCSPWDGPYNFVKTVSEMYPELLFELTVVEGGCDFSYKTQFMNGNDNEIEGGTFAVLCEEFGYELCDTCSSVLDYCGECSVCADEAEEVEVVA